MTQQQTITEFIAARLDDEQIAAERMAATFPEPWEISDRGWLAKITADGPHFPIVIKVEQFQAPDVAWLSDAIDHVYLHRPARVLREVAAKRAILAEHAPKVTTWVGEPDTLSCGRCGTWNEYPVSYPCRTLRTLAAIYSDHPDYNHEWSTE